MMGTNLSQGVVKTVTNIIPGGGLANGVTMQVAEITAFGCSKVKCVWGSWYGSAVPNDEIMPSNDWYLRAAIFDNANSVFLPFFFHGQRTQVMGQGALVVSDEVAWNCPANTYFGVETCGMTSGFDQQIPGYNPNYNTLLGLTFFPLGGYKGVDDLTLKSASLSANSASGAPAHQVLLGYFGSNGVPSLCAGGNSIPAGTGDAGANWGGGWAARLAWQCFTLPVTAANLTAPYCAYTCIARAGDTQENFLNENQNQRRLSIISMFTTYIDDLGTNNLSDSLATMKSNALAIALLITNLGVKCIGTTLLPKTTSTDNWTTTTNQTVTANETTRQGFNSWRRDTSSAGFVAQAIAQGCPANLIGIYDPAAWVEVNASNVFTHNGSYWHIPTDSAVYTGSVTSNGSTSGFDDSGLASATSGQYTGYAITITSGPNAGLNSCIVGNVTSTGQVVIGAQASAFTNGNTYSLWDKNGVWTIDGTHPTSAGHAQIASNLLAAVII
jgi:hypothetical protein